MTDPEVLRRLARLEARGEIENLMARYEDLYTKRDAAAILRELWAEDACGIWVEDRFYGVYEGRNGAFPDGGMTTYYDSVMGFGSPADHPGKLSCYTLTTQLIEVAADGETAQGLWVSVGAEGDAGELAYDDIGRPDRKVSGVHLTSCTPEGKRYQADWVWQKMRVDFIRRDTGWKIWHLHIYDVFRCPYGRDWVTYAPSRAADNERFGMERAFSPYGKPNGHGCEYYWEYSQNCKPPEKPVPPVPYRHAGEMSEC